MLEPYESSPRPVSIHAQAYPDGAATGWHCHERGQILAAARGLMIARTEAGTWYVPAGHALWLPPGTGHDVAMRGLVEMTSAYVARPIALRHLPPHCKVMAASPLLAAVIAALAAEPVLYAEDGRGGHLAALVIDEIARAGDAALALPVPRDRRLARLCVGLVAAPRRPASLDALADAAGMSRRSLTRRFRSETGLSIGDWVQRARRLAAMERR